MMDFNFDEMVRLHEVDPKAFDERREALLKQVIDNAPEDSKDMLEKTLFRIQMHRRKAKSPLQSALFASDLMWESFGKLRETLEQAQTEQTAWLNQRRKARLQLHEAPHPTCPIAAEAEPPLMSNSARVLPFRRV